VIQPGVASSNLGVDTSYDPNLSCIGIHGVFNLWRLIVSSWSIL
jgi:hypothetical protein